MISDWRRDLHCAVHLTFSLFFLGLTPCTAQEVDVDELVQRLRSPMTSSRVKAAEQIAQQGPMAAAAAPALIEALKCERIEVLFASGEASRSRRQFADALIRLGDSITPVLNNALKNENDLVRVWAAHALHEIEGEPSRERVIPVLVAALSAGNEAAGDAAFVLEKMGKDAETSIPALIEQLDHQDLETRCSIAHALAAIADAEHSNRLAKALQHDNPLVRVAAAFVMQRVDESSKDAQAVIAAALQNKSPNVRRQAVWAIGQLGESAQPLVKDLIHALPELTPDMRAYFFGRGALNRNSTDPSIALAATGPASLAALTAALDNNENQHVRVMIGVAILRLDPSQRERIGQVMKAAQNDADRGIRFLASMNSPRSPTSKPQDLDALIQSLRQPSDFGRGSPASGQLVRRGAEAVGPLMEVLKSGDGLVAGQVSRILAQIGEPALPALAEAMQSENDQLRVFAARALAGMGERAVDELTKALKDDLYPVRRSARYALKSIGTPESLAALRETQEK